MPNKKPNIILLVTDDTGMAILALTAAARGAACQPHILIGWQLKG